MSDKLAEVWVIFLDCSCMRVRAFIICLVTFVFAGSALAQPQWRARPSVRAEFTNSAVVILGKVISARDGPEAGGFIKGTFYSIQVAKVFKGSPPKKVELYSENSSGRFPMKVGSSYLILAYEGVFEGIEGRRLALDNRGNSGTEKRSKNALKILNELQHNQVPKTAAFGTVRSPPINRWVVFFAAARLPKKLIEARA